LKPGRSCEQKSFENGGITKESREQAPVGAVFSEQVSVGAMFRVGV